MTSYLQYFFNLRHLFSLRPQAMQPRALLILAIIFGVVVAVGLAATILKKKQRGLAVVGFNRLSTAGLTMGIAGFCYLFFAWQGVALLASRFWLLIWVVVAVVWAALIIYYFVITIPKRVQENLKKKQFEKYIP